MPRDWRVIIWITSWCHAILPANVLLIGLNYQILNNLIRKTNIFACDRCTAASFVLRVRNWFELHYYVNLRTKFNLNKFENLSIRFDRQSIINIQSLFHVMGWKWPRDHFPSLKCFIYVKIWFYYLTLPIPIQHKKKRIKLNCYFHTSFWCLKRFYESLKRFYEGL